MVNPGHHPILVMGARGSVGSHIVAELIARGIRVRASARRPEQRQFPDGVDVRAADLTDPASLASAFDGVERIFLYANHEGAQGVVDTARAAGVQRIVLLSSGSVVHPTSRGNPITEAHRDIEETFASATDLTVIPIRPLVLASNTLFWAAQIRTASTVALYQPDALTAPIHERDIAAVAVAALTGNDNTTDLLTGPARLSQRAQVAAIAATTDSTITIDALTRPDALTRFSRFMPTEQAEAVLRFLDDAAAGNSPATDAVERILGRPATAFTTWATDHTTDFG